MLQTDTDNQDIQKIFREIESEATSELSEVASNNTIDRDEQEQNMMMRTVEENSDLKRQIALLDQQCLEKDRMIERLNKVLDKRSLCCNITHSESVNTATQVVMMNITFQTNNYITE